MESTYTISILVNNKPGVLVRLAQTFARRGYNIESLVVSPEVNPNFSRMTVVVQGNSDTFEQIIRQLNKLIDVVHASHHQFTNALERELALFKVKSDSLQRTDIFQIVEVFRAKVVDITETSLIIETTGDSSKLDAMANLLETFGVIEMVRSGKLVIARGGETT